MKQDEYNELIELAYAGGGWMPANGKAKELAETQRKGEILQFKNVTPRDVNMHRCYFSLLSFIYDYMPNVFKKAVPINIFYKWIKHLKSEYEVIFTFKDEGKRLNNIKQLKKHNNNLGLDDNQIEYIALLLGKSDMIEYDSISFGRMNNQRFKEYVKEQLPYLYENVLGAYFQDEMLSDIIETIEQEYEKFMNKLN